MAERKDRRERSDTQGKEASEGAGFPEVTYIEKTIAVNRVAKVVKGGRNFSFNALVVAGDGMGQVGYGLGKAREVGDAVDKGTQIARRSMKRYPLVGKTIPHAVVGRFGAAKVVIRPASAGTGIIAGGAARAVFECLGVRDVLCKSLGTNNAVNVLRAAIDGLEQLYDLRLMARKRGMRIRDLLRTDSQVEATDE